MVSDTLQPQELFSQREFKRYSTRAERLGMFFSSVWVFFLVFPLYFAFTFPRDNIWQQSALVADLLLIIPVFLYGSIRLNKLNPRHRTSLVQAVIVLALLLLLTVGAVVFGEDWGYLSCFNFFLGCSLYILPFTVSACTSVLSIIAFYVISSAVGWNFASQYIVVMVIWPTIALLARYSDENAERAARVKDRISRMDERERAASDIHDLLGQTLTTISLKAQILAATADDATVRAEATQIQEIAVDGIEQMHRALSQMRRLDIDEEIRQAQSVCKATGIKCVVIGSSQDIAASDRPVCAAVIHEGITNVLRHAHAHQVHITINAHELLIDDDGVGLPDSIHGTGLDSVRKRLEMIGAHLYTEKSSLGGVRLRVILEKETD
ncbi:sensor histidine kinase [Alloscardovia omnicolens]|uniref:sensor histidine kinase n=1 Tax=Alloscardovia omnicolens TaxID=419015 RepID=UPI003A749475